MGQGAFGGSGLGAAAVEDRHVAQHTAVGPFVADADADADDEKVPFLPMAFAVDESEGDTAAAAAFWGR